MFSHYKILSSISFETNSELTCIESNAFSFASLKSISILPLLPDPEASLLYCYLIPLIFGCMAAGAAVEFVSQHPAKRIALVALSALPLFGFYLWSPLSYGTTHLDMSVIMWTNKWKWGDAYHQKLAKESTHR
jgi:hypothetical protein